MGQMTPTSGDSMATTHRPVTSRRSAAPGERSARTAHLFALVGGLWLAALAAGVLGPLADLTFVLIGTATTVATIVSARRPGVPSRPLLLALGAFVVWIIGGGLRESAGTLGDLSADRTLVPDAFSVTGYLLLIAAMTLLLPREQGDRNRQIDTALDTGIVVAGAAAISWVLFVAPVLDVHPPTELILLLVTYPALSLGVMSVALRAMFQRGRLSEPAARAVLASLFLLIVGDVWYMNIELGTVDPPSNLRDLPYAGAFLVFGAGVLHPTITRLGSSKGSADAASTGTRLRVVSMTAALGLPGVILLTGAAPLPADRLALGGLSLVLTTACAIRLTRAIRDQAHSQDVIDHLSRHDPITGLPNRTHVEEHLAVTFAEALNHHRSVAVLAIGLDNATVLSDGVGAATMDELLRLVAGRLHDLADERTEVGHLGGSDFVVVAQADTAGELEARAKRLQASFLVPFSTVHGPMQLSASVGYAIADGEEPAVVWGSLLDDSLAALHEARSRGGDRVTQFRRELRHELTRRVRLEQDLRTALADGQLAVHYQPISSLPEGRAIGFEALVRWEHAEFGEVSPAEFVPIAEESGLIIELGRFVLSEALAQLARWREAGLADDIRMSVNVSPREVELADVVDIVERALLLSGVPAAGLQLEITERLLIGDPGTVSRALSALRRRGVAIAIDDFGTGYSSLSHLRRFPVDTVKIDQSFITNLGHPEHESDESLIRAIVAMAEALDVAVVAEGVETSSQAGLLTSLGVRAAQGFRFGIPEPGPTAAAHLDPRTIDRL